MRAFRFLTLLPLLCLGSCTREQANAPNCCDFPETSIFLYLGDGSRETFTISQTGEKVNVSRDEANREVALSRHYRELLEVIFESEEWQKGASRNSYQGPWMGAPRTILRLEHQSHGLALQGDTVPKEWIAAIRSYTGQALAR